MRMLTGYAAVFYDGSPGSEYRLSEDAVERIMPSAFDASLASHDDVAAAWNHNGDYVLGSRAAGTLRLSKDSKGLRYEIPYDESDPDHQRVMAKVRSGTVTGASFSFLVRNQNVRRVKEGFIREILDVLLLECGPVWRPAYGNSTATARDDRPLSVREEYERKKRDPVYLRLQQIEADQVLERRLEIQRSMVRDRLRILDLV